MESKKSCPQGQYYCYTDKKCKKLPVGYHMGRGGYLAKDNDDSSDDGESSKNGNTYFLKPYLNTNQKDFGSKYDSFDSVDYKPVEGAVLIWPSHISHGSIPSVGEKNRIIVSANAKIELN